MATSRAPAGVGALLNPSMDGFLARALHALDHLAVIPDRGWIDRGAGASPRFDILPAAAELLDAAARERPVVLHGIGLSICSADFFDEAYADNLMDWGERLGAPWISDHLSFSRIGTGHETNAAITVPVPYDREVLELLVPRVRHFTQRMPFLLENNVYYFRYPDQEMTEEEFLNALCRRAGCGVLLDLHNLHTNAVNHGFSAAAYLDNLDLANVIEIHIAGGVPMKGFHTDSHTGPVLEEVWELLDRTVRRTKNLRGVTFEFHESSLRMMGEDGVLEQVEHTRRILNAHTAKEADVLAGVSARGR
jgi:uncharacterized protein (UPF0276 family)